MTTEAVLEWTRRLTQNLAYLIPGIRDEVAASLNDSLASSTPQVAKTNSGTSSNAGALCVYVS